MDFGVIGGADGPTAILVSGDPVALIVAAALIGAVIGAVVGIVVWSFLRKRKK